MAREKYHEAPVGTQFGKWIVQSYSHYNKEHYWSVLCSGCNNVFSRRAGQLVNKRSSGCQSCNSIEREKYSFWEGLEGISKQYLTKLKFRNKEVTCTLEDLVHKWKLQKGLCAYSGLKLSLVEKDTKWSESTASIDRINSDYGYHDWNIQWVHKRVNTMKNDMSEDEFIDLVYSINNWMKGEQ